MASKHRGKKIGIALGGGGARGFAHVGILQVLEEAGIPIDVIVGTSMGAVVGGLYARFKSIEDVTDRLQLVLKEHHSKASDLNVYPDDSKGDHFFDHVTKEIKQRLIINLSISRKALLPASRLEDAVASLTDDCVIEELPIPFAAIASDLVTGKGVILSQGSLRKAIVASSSIPGFFPPIEFDGHLLVDGEVTDLIPVETCFALGANYVIAVDVRRDLDLTNNLKHTMDVLLRSARITNYRYAESALKKAHLVIRPAFKDIQWSEFDRFNEIISAGKNAALEALPELRKAIKSERLSRLIPIWRGNAKSAVPSSDFKATHIRIDDIASS